MDSCGLVWSLDVIGSMVVTSMLLGKLEGLSSTAPGQGHLREQALEI